MKRLLFALFVFLYAASFGYAYVEYLNPVWEYFGFKMYPMDGARLAVGVSMLALSAFAQAPRITTPASLVVFVLYFNVYIPCLITSLMLSSDALRLYGPMLLALTAIFVLAGIAASSSQPGTLKGTDGLHPGFERFVLIAWALAFVIIAAYSGSSLSLTSLDDPAAVYEQRTAGATDNPVIRYIQTYFSNIFTPTLLCIGLIRRRPLWIAGAFAGGLLMYAVNAQRTLLLLPLILVAVFLLISRPRLHQYAAHTILAVLSVAMIWSAHTQEESLFGAAFAVLLTFRTIAIPGLTVSQYEDLFSEIGHTYWSNVKGFSLFVPPPDWAFNEPLWPDLGYIVGDKLYNNPIFNVNANLFAGDGVAAAGTVGILIIGLVFIGWIKLVDRLSMRWNTLFAAMVTLPPAISLTNGHFFTTMLSFGGIFWLLVFRFVEPPKISARMQETAPQPAGDTPS
ncbi:hypothetical protein [Pelomonas sp. Root1237]|uniref:hypothetical protein n=1 Tax=Pelomonas sp. Root1237 TaxID=1736434 RepID=UPI0006F58003|nr:hypothetical protein [Pelomonas sp. Root1237]KQV86544.1 hypothetical protein ASC91_22185 [Pelomonas sp. Root1237]